MLGRRIEMTAIRADGSEFPVELAIIRTPLDGPPSFTGFLRDITERKQMKTLYVRRTLRSRAARSAGAPCLRAQRSELHSPT